MMNTENHYTATWNGETITILSDDLAGAQCVAADVFGVDLDAPDMAEWGGVPKMTADQKHHVSRHGWFKPE